MIEEDKCECGASIPKRYGYYNYDHIITCFFCGRQHRFKQKELKE